MKKRYIYKNVLFLHPDPQEEQMWFVVIMLLLLLWAAASFVGWLTEPIRRTRAWRVAMHVLRVAILAAIVAAMVT